MSFTSVPFTIDENFSRLAGVAKFSAAGIVLEYEGKLFGIIKSGVKESRFSTDEILDVKFRKGFLKRGARIEIRLKSFARLNEAPNRDGRIILKIERDDYDRAEAAVTQLQKDLREFQESAPPKRTPVSRLFEEGEETKELNEK